MQKAHNKGFTIVELLIVIVVIAILATISIVAYNGIQDRAKNNATIAAATQVQKLITTYAIQTGQRLASNNYCLTQDNKCASDSGATPVTSDNSTIISTLQPYGTLPASVPVPSGIRTSYVSARTVDGVATPLFLVFWIKGTSQNCGMKTVVGSGTDWNTSTTGYSSSSGGYTQCVVPVTDPSLL